tara:strand:+ start:1323 stop:1922 length:600 start_codon:yes stop_codon:yes gene_type:complete
MSSISEINIGDKSHMNYYDPKENQQVSLVAKQLYPMHAFKVTTREVNVKGKYKAKVYNVIYRIAEECSQHKFDTPNGEVSGSAFVGKELYSTGIFMFLNPKPGDTFEPNNGANERYLRFCETMEVDCPQIVLEIDGEERRVNQFPELKDSDILGKPIMGFIDIEEYVKDGETRKSYKVKDFTSWSDGKVKDFAMDDLPF